VIVADANLIAYLLIPGPFSEEARRVLARDASWAAPVLWRSELSNVFAGYMRRDLMSLDGALERFAGAAEILEGSEYEVNFDEVLRLASTSGCSAYDCQYVLIARALDVPLVTSDKRILAAFPEVGIAPHQFAAN
jgi:predicted nucleic acid-binding protein